MHILSIVDNGDIAAPGKDSIDTPSGFAYIFPRQKMRR